MHTRTDCPLRVAAARQISNTERQGARSADTGGVRRLRSALREHPLVDRRFASQRNEGTVSCVIMDVRDAPGSMTTPGEPTRGRADAEPMGLARSEQAATFAEFYGEHFVEAARLASLLTNSREAAQDLAQDAFVAIHRRWSKVAEPRAYLRRAVVNACHSYHRRRILERRQAASPLRRTACLDAHELFDAIAMLPYRQRAALVLRFYCDLPEDEIATVLGCRPATVRSLVHRGLQQLRKVIEL
jgi:RNA polymerase sigma factor (sigma-70 family)